jgi:hypothetical protein
MTEAEWLACENPEWLVHALQTQTRTRSDRKLRLFACDCCRRGGESLLPLDLSVIGAIERCAEGQLQPSQIYTAAGIPGGAAAYAYMRGTGGGVVRTILEAAGVAAWSSAIRARESLNRVEIADGEVEWFAELKRQSKVLRCIFGNPFRPTASAPEWRTDTAVLLARGMYESRDFSAMPILADALQDAGCENADVLGHCRGPGPHVRGCWVMDLVLGKE